MKEKELHRDWLVLTVTCLAIGSVVNAVIFCLFIRFGIDSFVGKEALYLAALFIGINALVLMYREKKQHKSHKLWQQRLWRWSMGVLAVAEFFLLFALIAGVSKADFGSHWVKTPCLIGTILLPFGWGGNLFVYFYKEKNPTNIS